MLLAFYSLGLRLFPFDKGKPWFVGVYDALGVWLLVANKIGPYEADFSLVRAPGRMFLVVELDGRPHEENADRIRRDKTRDREIAARGGLVARFGRAELNASFHACARESIELLLKMQRCEVETVWDFVPDRGD
jgi:very-short-patch-repair endonuclease